MVTHLVSRNSSPKFGFGTSSREGPLSQRRSNTTKDGKRGSVTSNSFYKADVPGPGQYQLKSIIGEEGPKKSISGRFNLDLTAKELSLKPGPGQYTPSVRNTLKTGP